ncbi:uncharacterized protein Gem3 [Drosophila bipectinata]|uniref:uncharacterized protein Gem3 n=1 Tax=Drosophila bipectinata TaxID=42026 RepID=UPI001C89787B|nr:nucleoprotein TPR [Drosophila bipectinata]
MQRSLAHNLENGGKRTSDVEPGRVLSFSQLNLKRDVLRGLMRNKFTTPTRIQAAAIPLVLADNDLLIQSKSGTGKTLIYVLGAMNSYKSTLRWPHALIVVPTRELAIQVMDTFFYLSFFMSSCRAHAFIGGTDVAKDRKRMSESNVIIGTPGRLLHLYRNRVFDMSKIRLLVLDEADQLFETKGMQDTVHELISALPEKRQVVACSATYENNLDERLAKTMKQPLLISNSERATVLLGIRQFVYDLPQKINSLEEMRSKLDALLKIFAQLPYEQAILFASSKMRADSYRNYLEASGIQCSLLTGAMDQADRLNVFKSYTSFTTRIIVATDVMARGVDSKHANLVINLDPPKDHVTYLHRIGRAGRFGSQGIAITFVTPKETEKFHKILSACTTGMSVLEFPKDLTESENFSFWDFDKYNFPYYVKTESSPLAEMPVKGPKVAEKSDKVAEKDAEAINNKIMDSNESIDKDFVKLEAMEAAMGDPQQEIMKESSVEVVENGSNAPNTDLNTASEPKDDISKVETSNEDEKLELLLKKTDPMQGSTESLENALFKIANLEKEMAELQSTVHEKILGSAPTKSTEEPPQLEDKGVSTGEDFKLSPDVENPKLIITADPGTSNSIESSKNQEEVEKMSAPEKNSPNPDELFSPELTPSLTPLEISQEPSPTTTTPPAPPANSINTKTYCLVAPYNFSSSTTLQPLAISNTVDDASSISSDSLESGLSASQKTYSYESIFTISDEKEIWKRYKMKVKKHTCRISIRRPLLYHWIKRSSNGAKRTKIIYKKKIYGMYSPYPESNYFIMLTKFQNRKRIIERLDKNIADQNLGGAAVQRLMGTLYDSLVELYDPKLEKSSFYKPEVQPENDTKEKVPLPEMPTNKSSSEIQAQEKELDEIIIVWQDSETEKPSLTLDYTASEGQTDEVRGRQEAETDNPSVEQEGPQENNENVETVAPEVEGEESSQDPDVAGEPLVKLSIHVTNNIDIAPNQTDKLSLELEAQKKDGNGTDNPSVELVGQQEKNETVDAILPKVETANSSQGPDGEGEPPVKLSIHVTNNMDIAPNQTDKSSLEVEAQEKNDNGTDKPSLKLKAKKEENETVDAILPEVETANSSQNPDGEGEPPVKLSIHVTHNMNIAPIQPLVVESDSDGTASSQAGDNESSLDDLSASDDHNSSSGFVESNDSGSSGIDTSEYDASDTTVNDESDYEDDEDEDDYDPYYDLELTAEEFEFEEEEDEGETLDDDKDENEIMEVPNVSNVSLAGTSSEGEQAMEQDSDDDSEENGKIIELWQNTFATQYQFIASCVANYMAQAGKNEN